MLCLTSIRQHGWQNFNLLIAINDQRPSVASDQKFADYAYKSSAVTSKMRRVKILLTMRNFPRSIRKVTAT